MDFNEYKKAAEEKGFVFNGGYGMADGHRWYVLSYDKIVCADVYTTGKDKDNRVYRSKFLYPAALLEDEVYKSFESILVEYGERLKKTETVDLQKQLKETKAHLAEIEEKIKLSIKPMFWRPDAGGEYYCIENYDVLAPHWSTGGVQEWDLFPSAEQAKKVGHSVYLAVAVTKACLQVDPNFEPDWDNLRQSKYSPAYCHVTNKWGVLTWCTTQMVTPPVSTWELAQKACELLTSEGISPGGFKK